MSEASDYLENALVDHITGTSSFTMPTGFFVQLHNSTGPTEADGTVNAANTDAGPIPRRVSAGTMSTAGLTNGTSDNTADIDWLSVAQSETYTYYSLWDAATDGNFLMFSPFDADISVTAGDNFTIAAGNLTVTVA